jgi:hypothetical protein
MKDYRNDWIRCPRTTQERRVNGKRSKWNRGRRSAANLPTSYDDLWVRHERCWKSKRKTQYVGRGQEHTIYIPWNNENYKHNIHCIRMYYRFEKYLKEHDIPHRVEKIQRKEPSIWYNGHYTMPIGHEITWWSDKDIGLDYII